MRTYTGPQAPLRQKTCETVGWDRRGERGQSEWFSLKTGWPCPYPSASQNPLSLKEDSKPLYAHLCSASRSCLSSSFFLSYPRPNSPRHPQLRWNTSNVHSSYTSGCFPGAHYGGGATHTSLQPSPWGDTQRHLAPPDCPGWHRHHHQYTAGKEQAATGHLWRCSSTTV